MSIKFGSGLGIRDRTRPPCCHVHVDDILGVDILGVDILGVDILRLTVHAKTAVLNALLLTRFTASPHSPCQFVNPKGGLLDPEGSLLVFNFRCWLAGPTKILTPNGNRNTHKMVVSFTSVTKWCFG